eukprot:6469386-Amphidinium_carterae.7
MSHDTTSCARLQDSRRSKKGDQSNSGHLDQAHVLGSPSAQIDRALEWRQQEEALHCFGHSGLSRCGPVLVKSIENSWILVWVSTLNRAT